MSSSFHFATHNFVGPIELLLGLVRKRKLHINEVGLTAVADSFLEHFRAMPEMSLHHATHFLGVAATLVYVKSKSLFPEVDSDDESEEALSQLVDQMKLYSLIEKQIPKLRELEIGRLHTKKPTKIRLEGFQTDTRLTGYLLHGLVSEVIKTSEELVKNVREKVVRKVKPRIALSLMMDRVKDMVTSSGKTLRLKDLVLVVWKETGQADDPVDASISGFLATLEMVKQQDMSCSQEGIFQEILLTSMVDQTSYND